MKTFALIAAASLAALLSSPAAADSFGARIVDDGVSIGFSFGAPPAPYEYVPPGPPGAVWAPGQWNWNGYRYVWIPGRWVGAAPPAVIYAPAGVYPIVPAAPRWGFEIGRDGHRHHHHGHRDWGHRPHGGWRDR